MNILPGVISGIVFTGAITIDEKTAIPIGTTIVVMSGVWWLGRKLQALEDGQAEIRRWFGELPCKNGCELKKQKEKEQ